MARGTDNNQLKLAAKTRWRWQQQFVDHDKNNKNDDNDNKHNEHDEHDDEDNKHEDKDAINNQLILAAKTRWRWQQQWKQQPRAQQQLLQARQRLPWALAQTFSFAQECHRGR
jgi:hypothetical protein